MGDTNQYLLGIDIGSSQSKGVLVSVTGEIVAQHALSHVTREIKPGYYEHDAQAVWYGDFCGICKALLEKSGVDPARIVSVGASAIGPCVLPVGRDGSPLRNGILYGIDIRSVQEIADLTRSLGEEALLAQCGNLLSTQAAGPKILWIKRNEPEIYEKTWKFMTATTYLAYRLTGEVVIDHYTAGAGYTPLYDYGNLRWGCRFAPEIVEEEKLPRLAWSSEIAGRVTKQAAADTGLPQGIPVITGTCDAAAEAVSIGVVESGKVMLMFGTTVFIIAVTDLPAKDARMWSAPYLFPGTYSILGGMGAAGALTAWFRDELARELPLKCEETGENPYDVLAREAEEAPPGCDGLLLLPYFNGERTPLNDPFARGSYFGLTLRHTRAHLYRAVFESVGYGIRDNLSVISSHFRMPDQICAVGGGVKSRNWMQIVSDITGLPQDIYAVSLGASYGDAFLAGLGAGVFSTPQEIDRWLRRQERLEPSAENRALYDKQFSLYRALYQATRELMHRCGN